MSQTTSSDRPPGGGTATPGKPSEPRAPGPRADVRAGMEALEVQAEKLNRLEWLALLRRDQLQRWRDGDPFGVETYLDHLPRLRDDPEMILDLLYSEVLARRSLGEQPSLAEYAQRFPQHQAELETMFAVDAVLAGDPPTTPGEPPQPDPSPRTAGRELDQSSTDDYPAPGVVLSTSGSKSNSVERPSIPGYEIYGLLGRGGMGVVFKARQVGLDRVVALKMIRAGAHASERELARFRSEAEAVARLRHPNIVQIYEIGEWLPAEGGGPLPYFSLEFVGGGSLGKKLAGEPQPARASAQLVETLARTMHHAHQRGIIHRDLKPANILLSTAVRSGGSSAEGSGYGSGEQGRSTTDAGPVPKITDFGLAKRLDCGGGLSQTGEILGTPSYMAPEQAAGNVREVGPAADVYALGAILYELLTGRPPFQGPTPVATILQVLSDEPVPPTRRVRQVPRDLQTICLKCLEKDPAGRYPSALALADDLRAFLHGEPIQVRPQGAGERVLRWVRRQPAAALLLGIATVAAVGLVVGSWWSNALAVSLVAVVSLVVGGSWYYSRLQSTLRKLAQGQRLAERQVERLQLLLEMTYRLMSVTDLEALLRLISETTTRLANAERATVFLIDSERKLLWSKVALGDDVEEIRVPLGMGIAGTVAVTGETIHLPDAYADARFNREVDRRTGYQTRNLLAIPMRSQEGRVIGVFQVLNKRNGPFQPEDVEPLTVLAASAAAAVENAQRFRGQR